MTHLQTMMVEELVRRNYSEATRECYIRAVEEFSVYFKCPPDRLGLEQIRIFQAHLFRDRKLSPNTVNQHLAALRFFFVKTLRRHWNTADTPYPKREIRLPKVLSPEEVALLIDSAIVPFHRMILMTLYATGVRRAELTAIIRAFTLGVEFRLIPFAPKIETLEENNVRKGFFQREQLDSVLPHLRPHNQAPARFAFVTGWRKQEILELRWPQVDFQAGTACLEPGTTKNKEARVFPFTTELREILEGQKAKSEALRKKGIITPLVFFIEERGKRCGKRIGDFKRNWNSACMAAGIPGRIFHDFRRTAVRNLVRAGIPERVAMQMTGHKTRNVFERYNIVSEGDLFEAARKLEIYSTGKDMGKDAPKSRKSKNLKIAK